MLHGKPVHRGEITLKNSASKAPVSSTSPASGPKRIKVTLDYTGEPEDLHRALTKWQVSIQVRRMAVKPKRARMTQQSTLRKTNTQITLAHSLLLHVTNHQGWWWWCWHQVIKAQLLVWWWFLIISMMIVPNNADTTWSRPTLCQRAQTDLFLLWVVPVRASSLWLGDAVVCSWPHTLFVGLLL